SVRLSGATHPRDCVALAKIAEANGYHAVWFPENAFGRGALPAASACAAATTTIGIGIGVFNPYSRHPTLMAMEIAALDELAQALALAGKLADGLIISNMCPAEFTQAAVLTMREAARQAQRAVPAEIVQYVPCAVRLDRAEAHALAKREIGEMLASFWSLGARVPSAKAALLRAQGISERDVAAAVARLRAGERAAVVLDDGFVEAFA